MRLASGARIGPYEIIGLLGEGGMGEVYRALDTRLEREVALKVLPDRFEGNSEARDRFARESKAIAALSHPNILVIHDVGEEGPVSYAVTELLQGETLGAALKREKRFELARAVKIALGAARGLAAAHAKHIVHRDIKPDNMFLTAAGEVKILDFGLARSEPEQTLAGIGNATAPLATMPGTILGTLGYMSPEQAKGGTATAASDVFSLGCVFYEMLAGQRPFGRPTPTETLAAIISADPPPLTLEGKVLPGSLARLVMQSLDKDPRKRPATAAELVKVLEPLEEELSGRSAPARAPFFLRPWVALPAAAALAALGFFLWRATSAEAKRRWAREEALPQVIALGDAYKFREAFKLAREAEQYIPTDPMLAKQWEVISSTVDVTTDPPDAEVFYKPYSEPDADWELVGRTPIAGVRLPSGVFRWKIEKAGFEPREGARYIPSGLMKGLLTAGGLGADLSSSLAFKLDPAGTAPPGMVAVEEGRYATIPLQGFPPLFGVNLTRYYIDRTEVTNREYKEFVKVGGYEKPEFWKQPFTKDGADLAWDAAIKEFMDSTGRPGPASWVMGDFPEGKAEEPVSGVSWFEAAAYAEYRGKQLPTIYHWVRAALAANEIAQPISPEMGPLSNFKGEGLAPVTANKGISIEGAYDMGGNVREWAWNANGADRHMMGGSFEDEVYLLTFALPVSPWQRFPVNGFRCMKTADGAAVADALLAPVDRNLKDFASAKPLSEEASRLIDQLSEYAPLPLDAQQVAAPADAGGHTTEKVSITLPYGGQRMVIRIKIPAGLPPPHQAVVVFPGINALQERAIDDMTDEEDIFNFFLKSGRAVVEPVFSETFDRNVGRGMMRLGAVQSRRVVLAEWKMDLKRTIEYLQSRPDIDAEKLAYCGMSLGSTVAPMMLAAETRVRAVILMSGGYTPLANTDEELSAVVTSAQRVKIPALMINGRYDYVFPLNSLQIPLFNDLGAPPDQKKHVILEAGHAPLPRVETIRESVDWLDRYLGPVASGGQ